MTDTTEAGLDPATLSSDLEIDPINLNHGFLRQAALFSYYAHLHVAAMRREAKTKLMLEIEEAKLAKMIRDKLAEDGVKSTEKMIEQEISRSASYIKAANAYNEARADTALAHGAVEAFRHRRDMLVQLGANQREEMKGELRTLDPAAAAGRVVSGLRSLNAA